MTLARGEREWALLVSEYNICKKKLESKRQALKILMGDLESCQRERDIYKNKIKQMQQEIENYKKKELENDHKDAKGRRSPASPSVRSPEHTRPKRERKFSGQTIWEQELQSVRDRKNKTLSQLLCESREENKALKNDFMDLRVLYREAQEDIILLRENVSRQRTNERGCKMEDLEARQELIQRLEKNQEKVEELEREVEASNDEKSEIVIERDHYRDKVERLNTQLNFILGADERRLVDIDAILMENRYQKEQIKQLKDEMRSANASVARQKAAIEKKKARLAKAGYHTGPGHIVGGAAVKQTLPSLIADISSSFNHGVSSSTVSDLQSLANSLSESLSEKDIALLHQRNTNKILGNRVAELEKKLKTLEVSGLWSLEGHRGYGSEELLQLYLEKLKRSSSTSHDKSSDTIKVPDNELPSAESSPDLHNGESVFFDNNIPDTDQELIDVSTSSFTPTISEEEDNHSENNDTYNLDLSPRRETCVVEQHPSEGQFHNGGDSTEHKDHDDEGDSPVNKSNEGESCEEGDFSMDEDSHNSSSSQMEGDSLSTSQINGDSPSTSQIDGDSHTASTSQIDGDSHTASTSRIDRDSHASIQLAGDELESSVKNSENQDFKENTLANTATNSIKDLTNNNSTVAHGRSKPSHQSGEHSRLNAPEEHLALQYGSLEEQSYQIKIKSEDRNDYQGIQTVVENHESFQGDVSPTEGESTSDYYEPDSSSLDDVEDQAH